MCLSTRSNKTSERPHTEGKESGETYAVSITSCDYRFWLRGQSVDRTVLLRTDLRGQPQHTLELPWMLRERRRVGLARAGKGTRYSLSQEMAVLYRSFWNFIYTALPENPYFFCTGMNC